MAEKMNFQFLVICIFMLTTAQSQLKIVVEKEEVEVYETNKAELPCKVENLEDGQVIAWYRGSEKIDKNNKKDRYEIISADYNELNRKSYDLVISNSSRTDQNSKYTCEVLLRGKNIMSSKEVTLKIRNVPVWTHPHFYPECKKGSTGVRIGKDYQVSCKTERTEPPVRIVLKKGNKVVCNNTASQNTECSYSGVATEDDIGIRFTCYQIGPINVPDYPAGVTRRCNIGALNILKPPDVEITGDYSAIKGREVVQICDPSEATTCSWVYTKNYGYMDTSEETTGNVCILRLTVFVSSNINKLNITCVAENSVGFRSNSKVITFFDSTSPTPIAGEFIGNNTATKSPLWTGVIIAITGCFAIVIVLVTSVILYCGWRHFLPVYSQAGVPSQEIYSEQFNRSPYRMQSVQKCVAIQVTDEENECVDDVEKKLTTESTKQGEQHYSHICSP